MRDAEGRQRLALKTVGGKRAPAHVTTHVTMARETMDRVLAVMRAEGRASVSNTIGRLLNDALSDDALTAEEGRVILRGLRKLADGEADEATMDTVERVTEKLEKAFPEGVR
jgi:hypothetical protein